MCLVFPWALCLCGVGDLLRKVVSWSGLWMTRKASNSLVTVPETQCTWPDMSSVGQVASREASVGSVVPWVFPALPLYLKGVSLALTEAIFWGPTPCLSLCKWGPRLHRDCLKVLGVRVEVPKKNRILMLRKSAHTCAKRRLVTDDRGP